MTSSVTEVPDEYMELARSLSLIHGTIRIAREASGLHFYMASPYCLEHDGEIELHKMHLALNVDKYFGENNAYAGMCMKSGELYSVHDLQGMPTVAERGYDFTAEVIVKKEQDM